MKNKKTFQLQNHSCEITDTFLHVKIVNVYNICISYAVHIITSKKKK